MARHGKERQSNQVCTIMEFLINEGSLSMDHQEINVNDEMQLVLRF